MLPEKCKSQAHMLQCEALWDKDLVTIPLLILL